MWVRLIICSTLSIINILHRIKFFVSGYYFYNLITPVLIIVSIGFFTVFLPPFSGDKINLAVTSLLGFLFVQEIIAELMPKSESIPCLAIYVERALLVSTFNVAACSCIVAVYNLPKERRPPIFLRVILVRIIGGVLYGLYSIAWNLMCVQHHRLCFKPRVSNMLRELMARHTNQFVDFQTFQIWRANRSTREPDTNHHEKLPDGLSQSPCQTFNGVLYSHWYDWHSLEFTMYNSPTVLAIAFGPRQGMHFRRNGS